jgi:hypothetical protein
VGWGRAAFESIEAAFVILAGRLRQRVAVTKGVAVSGARFGSVEFAPGAEAR